MSLSASNATFACRTAIQFVLEEKIMTTYSVTPLEAVGLEGFFGLLTILLISPVLIHFKSKSEFLDLPRGFHQMMNNPPVLGSALAIATSIGFYNFFGLSVTRHISATMRSIIDTCRTISIWIVSLGLGWELLVWPASLLQVAGFCLLVYVCVSHVVSLRADHALTQLWNIPVQQHHLTPTIPSRLSNIGIYCSAYR